MPRGRRPGVPNRNFPTLSLEKALELARALHDGASGLPTDRLTLSELLDRSPSSSAFTTLILASRAYGLTNGGKNADEFSLTQVGRQAVSDDSRERTDGLRRAVLSVEPFTLALRAYDKKKVPLPAAFKSFLTNQAGVHADHAEQCMNQLLDDARLAGFLRHVKGSDWIDLQNAALAAPLTPASQNGQGEEGEETLDGVLEEEDEPGQDDIVDRNLTANREQKTPPRLPSGPPKVFITHGKNEQILQQLKELLTFGKFEPIIAKEHETVSKPVPDKVLEDMRQCSAAVIHVATEDRLLDEKGNEHHKINENVLIEIGAAMALYGRNFILLSPTGLHLPSNLQGLYRCEYTGDTLDYEATMKLLKAFNELELTQE
jgi:predicted nucleotide-binding protein